jgi:hypothetical protein
MTVRPLAAALLATAALGLAACGGGDPEEPASASGGGTPAADEAEARQARVDFAQCMREHGVDFPDPGPEGGPVKIENLGSPEKVEAAQEACQRFLEKARPELSEAQQAEFKEKALEHARCMRDRGIDFPDPQFSADGGARIELERGRVDLEDPDFKAAQEECGEIMEAVRP